MIGAVLHDFNPWLHFAAALLLCAVIAAPALSAPLPANGRSVRSARRPVIFALAALMATSGAAVAILLGPLDPEQQFPLRQREVALIERELAYRDRMTDTVLALLDQNHQLDVAELRQNFEPQLAELRRQYAEVTEGLAPPDSSAAPILPASATGGR